MVNNNKIKEYFYFLGREKTGGSSERWSKRTRKLGTITFNLFFFLLSVAKKISNAGTDALLARYI